MKELHPPRPGVSVVLPVYNEIACVEQTLRELSSVLQQHVPAAHEILAVDDGSQDGTDALLCRLAKELPGLRVLRLDPNSGQSAAFDAGFRAAEHETIVTMDADGQNDPADIPALTARLSDCDLCCGYRAARQDTWSKKIGSRIGNAVRNQLLRETIRDTGCSLKAFRADFVKGLPMFHGMHRFLPALCQMRGARIEQVPVNHRPRTAGLSKYTNFGRLKTVFADALAVRWMQRRTRRFSTREISS